MIVSYPKNLIVMTGLLLTVIACKTRSGDDSNSAVLAAGGGAGSNCAWADYKEPKNINEAMAELKKELFLLSAGAEGSLPKLEQARAKLLLVARAEGVPADKYVADCACTQPPEKEISFAQEKADALNMTSALAERVAKVQQLGGNEAATEALMSVGQMAVRFGAEGAAELSLTVTNEIYKAVTNLAGSGIEMAVPDVLTAGLALEVSESTESGSQDQAMKVVEYAERMFAGKDQGSSSYFQEIAGKSSTKQAVTQFTQTVAPQRRFEDVRQLVADGKIFEEVGKLHSSFRSPEQTKRLMEAAKRAPRVRLFKGPML